MKQRMSDLIQSEKNVKLRNNKHEKEADVDTKIELSDRESQEKRTWRIQGGKSKTQTSVPDIMPVRWQSERCRRESTKRI